MNIACRDCWFNRDGICQYDIQKDEILADLNIPVEQKIRLLDELKDKALIQKCPNAKPPQGSE